MAVWNLKKHDNFAKHTKPEMQINGFNFFLYNQTCYTISFRLELGWSKKVKFLAFVRILVYVKLYSRLDRKVYKRQNLEVIVTRHKWNHLFAVDQAFDFKVRYSLFTL